MIPKNTLSYLMATAAILDIKAHPNRQQCNLWTVIMCFCENIRIVADTDGRKLNITFYLVTCGIACVRLKQRFFEIETNTQNFKNKHIVIPEFNLIRRC